MLANARYWTTVAPRVRAGLLRWEERARAIPNPALQTLAAGKLRDERFNVEVAATLATLAPRTLRASVTEAIVALQVAYDYLDAIGEQPPGNPPREDGDLLQALSGAFAPRLVNGEPAGEGFEPDEGRGARNRASDGGYLNELVATVRRALSELPATAAVAPVARACARRCAHAQLLTHAAARADAADAELWATREAAGTGLHWPEFLAGASASVLGLHALIAAAADPRTTPRDAEAIDAAYLSIGALTMLDSLIDREQDLAAAEPGYVRHYAGREQMASRLAVVACHAAGRTRKLPHAAHHTMTLTGVVAYYGSAPAASGAFARPVIARVHNELRPLITPTLAIMRAWRLAKSVCGARSRARQTTTQDTIVSSTQGWRTGDGLGVLQKASTDQGRA